MSLRSRDTLQFDAIILSSLISTFAAPFLLRKLLESEKKQKQEVIAMARAETTNVGKLGEYSEDDDNDYNTVNDEERGLVEGENDEEGRARATSNSSTTSTGSR